MKNLTGKTLIQPGWNHKTGRFDNWGNTVNSVVVKHSNGSVTAILPTREAYVWEESTLDDDISTGKVRVVNGKTAKGITLKSLSEDIDGGVLVPDDGAVEITPEGDAVVVSEPDDEKLFLSTAQLQQIQGVTQCGDTVDCAPMSYQVTDVTGTDGYAALAWDPGIAHRDYDAVSQGDWVLVNNDGSISDGSSAPEDFLFGTVEAAVEAARRVSAKQGSLWEQSAKSRPVGKSGITIKKLAGKTLEYVDRRIGVKFKQGFLPTVKRTGK